MKRLITLSIIIITLLSSCYDDTPNKPNPSSISTIINVPQEEPALSCYPGKMSCIDNASMLCYEGEWIIVDDCTPEGDVCHFNEPDLSWGIPFFAVCVGEQYE